MEQKYRVWDKEDERMIVREQDFIPLKVCSLGILRLSPYHEEEHWVIIDPARFDIMQHVGLEGSCGQEFYIGDIGEFKNGDRFVLKLAEWLEVFAEWIGEPINEDATRDLYRIEDAKIIGNIHQDSELLTNEN